MAGSNDDLEPETDPVSEPEPASERSDTDEFSRIPLGEIDPARSRHMWTRSAVHATDDLLISGQWDGTVTASELDSLETRWTVRRPDHAVEIATLGTSDGSRGTDAVVTAGRGETGTIAAFDAETGEQRWRYDTVEDVGEAVDDSVFYYPYVVALETDPASNRLYAAARRYERDGETRRWDSTVYAFDADGAVRWRYETDASPIALDLADDGERLAVGYNRCPGDHDTGLVVLGADTGEPRWTWDPGTAGDRRVGDVSFDGDAVAVASHGDKRGYLLGSGGTERWTVDLAVETEIDGERLYAYPNHVHATEGVVAFVTGNTYAVDGRETENRHPNEHRLAAFDAADGTPSWNVELRGFAHELVADDGIVVAPCAQNFRVRDPDTHAVRWFDLASGDGNVEFSEGVTTAATIDGETIAVVEEPVAYHDEGQTRGEYALRVGSVE